MALGLARLARSGLSAANARGLGIKILSRAAVTALSPSFQPLAALRLNYFAPSGAPTGFYRLRYLEAPTGFAALTAAAPPRYAQAPGTGPEAYWPRGVAWAQLAGDPPRQCTKPRAS